MGSYDDYMDHLKDEADKAEDEVSETESLRAELARVRAENEQLRQEHDLLFLQNAKDACEIAELKGEIDWWARNMYMHMTAGADQFGPRSWWGVEKGVAEHFGYARRKVRQVNYLRQALEDFNRSKAELAAIYSTRCTITEIPAELLPEPEQVRAYLEAKGWVSPVSACKESYWVPWVKNERTVAFPGRLKGRESQFVDGLHDLARFEGRNAYEVLSAMREHPKEAK